jgi:hypothetical protein
MVPAFPAVILAIVPAVLPPMTFGDQVMHSGRGCSRDIGDISYLRCCPKTSATNSRTSDKYNMFRWSGESGGMFRTIVTPCRLLNREE